MQRKVDVGVTVGLLCIAFGCLFICLAAQVVTDRSDEFEISLEARAGLEQELRQEREKYQRDMNGALEKINELQGQPNGPTDDAGSRDTAGEQPTAE